MSAWVDARRILPLEGPRIVTVGLLAGTKILTGKRRDNGLWTNPGGHLDQGETLLEGAAREVLEETGIEIKTEDLELISAERITSHRTGKQFSVFAFIARIDKERASGKDDPDQEVQTWKWVELSPETPELAPKQRHALHDSVLCHLGQCRSHGRLSKQTFSEKRLSMTSDEYTEGSSGITKEIQSPEGQAIDNLKPDPRRST